MYGTNHTKLNVLQAYPFSETDVKRIRVRTGTGIPVLLFPV